MGVIGCMGFIGFIVTPEGGDWVSAGVKSDGLDAEAESLARRSDSDFGSVVAGADIGRVVAAIVILVTPGGAHVRLESPHHADYCPFETRLA